VRIVPAGDRERHWGEKTSACLRPRKSARHAHRLSVPGRGAACRAGRNPAPGCRPACASLLELPSSFERPIGRWVTSRPRAAVARPILGAQRRPPWGSRSSGSVAFRLIQSELGFRLIPGENVVESWLAPVVTTPRGSTHRVAVQLGMPQRTQAWARPEPSCLHLVGLRQSLVSSGRKRRRALEVVRRRECPYGT
jgi:hypothetical protein